MSPLSFLGSWGTVFQLIERELSLSLSGIISQIRGVLIKGLASFVHAHRLDE